ncbi:MAG TPA: NADP-dependent malic enzyme [Candidatus Hydrogenedentes bacterium]|nr:NADP-dependent malic enzyme [Candidatus Hydrogenedentota bacterium]HOL78309.1 NADP-dependent malic enzyme [Candidatus Hydrogenedentota bacterium]HPO85976.1 NADP-dependent malic enzyme [Candidatus Hydrogenedentota bacterium]
MITRDESLRYHREGRRGKIEVTPTKPCRTQRDLSLAYTPGVAEPCRVIEKDPAAIYEYTAKGNLVAVISNGTAVLGLGDIGAAAGKPVMEGKGVLFKRFADIDVFDIELDTHDPDEFIRAVKLMEPTFGGINLEDIKAPECFYIEERLIQEMNIPVFHDDQHGTAIISGAGLLNALELVGKRIEDVRVVFNGAGAAGIACARFYVMLGVRPENLILCDSKGVVYKGRTDGMNPYKDRFAVDTDARTLADALRGADVFAGLSVANVLTPEMIRSMAERPIVFAMANPDPEIKPEVARSVRNDLILATGRSDYPNQINNVLGFPFIFRGALDVRARAINDAMKLAAAHALANLAKQPVPYQVVRAYRLDHLQFGEDYIIPKPFDPRVLIWEASAVAQAAMESGVAGLTIDIEEYKERLEARLGYSRKIMRVMINKARKNPKRIVYPEGDHPSVLKACETVLDEGMAQPVLLGSPQRIEAMARDLGLHLRGGVEIIDPRNTDQHDHYEEHLYELRQRKGLTRQLAHEWMVLRNYFGAMMVYHGDADGMVSGLTANYPDAIRPALQVIGPAPGVKRVAAMNLIATPDQLYFFADVAMNVMPDAEELADIAILCARAVRRFDVEPRIAMVSFSNFGGTRFPESEKMRQAVELVRERAPELIIDGEVQADIAVTPEILSEHFPFTTLKEGANVLIFPCLSSSNAAYKLAQRFGKAEAIGPILLGMRKPVHILQYGGFNEADVVNMTAIAVVDAQDAAVV